MPDAEGNYTPPESGDLPEAGKKILKEVYSKNRREHPDWSKEKCAKIAWGAVEQAGYHKGDDGHWVKKSDAGSVAPMTADIDSKHGKMEIKKSWPNELQSILSSPRVAEMTFHVPKVDKDLEFITPSAMSGAIEDYKKFPIISEFHKERPVGIAEKIWQTGDDEFKARVRIRDDPSTDDVWDKINLPKGTPGRYDQVSIAGKRIVYSQECNIPLGMRKAEHPCRTEKLRLDSISICDDRARNDETTFNVVKAESDEQTAFVYTTALEITKVEDSLIKAETTESELIHPVTDGANQADAARSRGTIVNPLIETGTRKCTSKCTKGEKMVKKAPEKEPEEEKKEEVEEKAEPGTPEKQAMEKGDETEAHEAKESSEVLAAIKELKEIVHKLVASDKKVHATVEKGEPPEESPADKEEEKEKRGNAKEEESRAKREEKKDENVHKAAMEQDFQKALDATVAPLKAQIDALSLEVKRLGDEPMFKAGIRIETLTVDHEGKVPLGNAGALAAMRKKQQKV